jgi:hypothetical protein
MCAESNRLADNQLVVSVSPQSPLVRDAVNPVDPAPSLPPSIATIGVVVVNYGPTETSYARQLIDSMPPEFSLLPIADDLVANTFLNSSNRQGIARGPVTCKVVWCAQVNPPATDADAACGKALLQMHAKLLQTPSEQPTVLVVMPADGTFDSRQVPILCSPIIRGEAEIAVGSRQARGSLSPDLTPRHTGQDFAARWLFRIITEKQFSDFSPFRAMRFEVMQKVMPRSAHRSWALEMQWRAVRQGVRIREIDAGYRAPETPTPGVIDYAVGLPLGLLSAIKTVALVR